MSTLLVTGAAGFVGRSALGALGQQDAALHAVSRRPQMGMPGIWHATDLLREAERRNLVEAIRPTHLVHLAWATEPRSFWDAPENTAWTAATLDLLHSFHESGGQRALLVGSCAEYDWTHPSLAHAPCREYETPCLPNTVYGKAKHETHVEAASFARQTGLSLAWVRLFHLFGPGERQERLVPSIVRSFLRGSEIELRHPENIFDFMDVRDVGRGLVSILASPLEGAVNLSSGVGISVRHLAEKISLAAEAVLGEAPRAQVARPGQASAHPYLRLVGDVSRLRQGTGFHPEYDLDRALADAIAWWSKPESSASG